VSCGRGTLVKYLRDAIVCTSCRCRCWSCPTCAPLRRWQCEQEIIAGEPETFMTLGCVASRYESPDEARADMGRAMPKLAKRIRRKWPDKEFEYAVYVEAFKSGYPHFHIACRATFIPQDWLSEQWGDLIGAPVVHLRHAGTPNQIARYLCKYLVKAPHQFGKAKRYWYSQGYRPRPVFDESRRRRHVTVKWSRDHIQATIASLAHHRLIPLWNGPDHCVLAQPQAP